jgi:hypothetical protein
LTRNLKVDYPEPHRYRRPTEQHTAVDAFISRVAAGRKIRRMDIWMVAGYAEETEFQRWQRGAGNLIAAERFRRVLSMPPREFIRALDAAILKAKRRGW